MTRKPADTPAQELVARAYALKTADESHQLYHDWAQTYDDAMVGDLLYNSPRKCAELLSRHLGDQHGLVLDVGCGTGLAGAELARLGYRQMDGIDISRDMLDMAGKRGIYLQLLTADLLKPLDIKSQTYDGAICTGTFTHAHVGAGCLDELFRVLKTGGIFAFTVHRDVYGPLGFEEKLAALEQAGTVRQVEHYFDSYFDTAKDLEGHFFAYRKV